MHISKTRLKVKVIDKFVSFVIHDHSVDPIHMYTNASFSFFL